MKPKILVFDIENSPIFAAVWGLRDQNIPLNMIEKDFHIMSYAAKWFGDSPSKVMYDDQRHAKNVEDDRELLKGIWKLLDEADIVITQNGQRFDSPKLNARFIQHGMKPPSPYRHLDTLRIIRKVSKFTSNKLEYLSEKLCTKYKKLSHKKFPGYSLWRECIKGNVQAWDEMKKYNIHDVLATEELYTKIQAWDNSINLAVYGQKGCVCGSVEHTAEGFSYTANGKFQRFKCKRCGKWSAGRENLLTKLECVSSKKSAGAH